MIHYLVAFGLWLHAVFWGVGAAVLLMPVRWARFWPVLVLPMGFALQSAVVWIGAHAGLAGTQEYAWPAELLPVGLLGFALWRRGLHAVRVDAERFGLVAIAMVGALALAVLPVALASRGLTTISLGSCDAADYAAGARTLMEFPRGERGGFIGLAEVVRVHSVDNFFDYWLRLNHFTPAALLAFNGTIFDCAPHEITTLLTAVLLVAIMPVVFWSARVLLGYSAGMSLLIAALFGVNPVMWYAVAHVSPGQLLAAPAIGLLTWCGVALWRGRLTWRAALHLGGVQLAAYWLILGSYNFIVVVSLVPAAGYAFGLGVWQRAWRRLGRWTMMMAAPLLVAGLLFAPRVAGLAERFTLLQTYDFGWRIPVLTAEGWLGMVRGPDLEAWSWLGLRWLLSAVIVGLLVWAFLRAAHQRRRAAWMALSSSLPIFAGYFFLEARGSALGTNASYDAYKLLAVFYPLLLPACCWWVTLRRSGRLHEWLLVWCVAGVVGAFNLLGCGLFIHALSRPPLIVDGALRQLRQVETMPDVRSVNLLVPDMWSRLWANVFLLRTPHYFPTHTYEGRRDTPLHGEWDLLGGRVAVALPGPAQREIAGRFSLVDTRHPAFLRVTPAAGWFEEERDPRTGERWRWTSGTATLQVQNPQAYPLRLSLVLEGWSPVERSLILRSGENRLMAPARLGPGRTSLLFPEITVAPGATTLELSSPEPTYQANGDPRPLGAAVFRLQVTPERE